MSFKKQFKVEKCLFRYREVSPLAYIECKPKAIILGTHCSKEDTQEINEIAKKIGIFVYRMYLDEGSPQFKLNLGNGRDYNNCI